MSTKFLSNVFSEQIIKLFKITVTTTDIFMNVCYSWSTSGHDCW